MRGTLPPRQRPPPGRLPSACPAHPSGGTPTAPAQSGVPVPPPSQQHLAARRGQCRSLQLHGPPCEG
eukprot:15458679-Alexandrium_andersonii.AAC.1